MPRTLSTLLLCVATSQLFQITTAQAVVFPYNCDSTEPICQQDCITAVENICNGLVSPLIFSQNTTVGACTAKYMPYNGTPDTKVTCLANFQKILDVSSPAASTCDGKTLGRVGGVLAFDVNNKILHGTAYAIFPVENNPNCVVNPNQVHFPVPARYNLNGTVYSCPNPATTGLSLSHPGINTRGIDAACGLSIGGAAVCSAVCVTSVVAVFASFGITGAISGASCLLCIGGETYLVYAYCFNHSPRRDLLGSSPFRVRSPSGEPAYCSGSALSGTSLQILPACLQPAFQASCQNGLVAAA
ncbi:hypothetical protein MMC12_006506 [Toensbergia leucococca]|nr:hypothetical protein [Toensbergia leucococca]